MPNILVVDFFNLVKRYTFLLDEIPDEGEFYSVTTPRVINKIVSTMYDYKIDFLIVCSDLGFNKRANSVLGGNYKANRKRAKSLTQEEKERSYIEKLKNIIKTLPCIFVEMQDVEADSIIYLVINYISKRLEDSTFYIASSDSDFLQCLDTNVSIIDWNKGLVNINNWKSVHKLECEFLKPKDYALLKALVGDTSDNIKGIKGLGWKTVLKLLTFLYLKLNKNLTINNVDNIYAYLTEIRNNHIANKKELLLCDRMLGIIDQNRDAINKNFSVISLDMLETPYIAKIMQSIESSLKVPVSFDKKIFLEKLKFEERFADDVEYRKILDKNLQLVYMLKKLSFRANKIREKIL